MAELRVGVVGVGHLGKEHARILGGMRGVELVGVADPNPNQLAMVSQKCGTRGFTDYRALMPLVDAVVVAAPTAFHCGIAREFLQKGIPLLVEKPLAPTLAEAEELVTLAERQKTILQVGHIERFNPAYCEMRRRALQPKYITCERYSGFTGRSTDIGVVLDLMIHDIDLTLDLVQAPVASVEAIGVAVLGGHEDVVQARVRFTNGCVADLTASRVHPVPVRRMTVWAAEGFLAADLAKRQVQMCQPAGHVTDGQFDSRRLDSSTQATIKNDLFGKHLLTHEVDCGGGDQLTWELEEFTHSVETGSRPRVDGIAGREALALAGRILDSVRQHAWNGTANGPVGPTQLPTPLEMLFPQSGQKSAAA